MIYCTKCGTANEGGTRFCNECGAPLIHTGQLCPECGVRNPMGTVFCDNCNARLVPRSKLEDMGAEPGAEEEAPRAPIKGLSLPTIPLQEESTGEAERTAPADEEAWLSDLRATVEDEIPGLPRMEEGEPSGVVQDLTGAAPEPSEDPDWLKRLQADSPFPDSEPDETPGETPEWLEELQAQTPPLTGDGILVEDTPSAESPATAIAPSRGAGIPDWLQDLGTAAPLAPEAEITPVDEGTPEWLTGLTAEPPAAPSAEAPPPGTTTTDWLEGVGAPPDLAPQAEFPGEERPPTPEFLDEAGVVPAPTPAAAAPDWLEGLDEAPAVAPDTGPPAVDEAPPDLGDRAEAVPEPTPEPQAPPDSTGADDWLQGLAEGVAGPPSTGVLPGTGTLPEWLERIGTGPLPTLPTDAEGKPPVPDWLQSTEAHRRGDTGPLEPSVVEPVPQAPVLPPEGLAIPVEPGELPDWLMQARPTPEGEQPPSEAEAGTAPVPSVPDELLPGGLAPAEIPEWMQALRPGTEAEAPEGPPETEGLLEGMRGTLLASTAVEGVGQLSSAPRLTSAASIARAQLLQELLSRPAEQPEAAEQRRRAKLGWTAQRLLVSLLFAVTIIAPMTGAQLYDSDAAIPTTGLYSDAERVYDLIETQVQPEDSVLVAFAYDASSADEMSRVAEPIVLHLLRRGARLTPVSTLPEGPALAESLIARLSGDTQVYGVAAPVYQPGQAAGVQALLTDVSDVALVVVLSGEPGEFRTWLEQVRARSVDLPVVAGISARVEPDARPYLDAQSNLNGIVVGLVGAAAYESSVGSIYRPASFYLQSLAVSHLLAVVLLILGGVVHIIGGRHR